MGGITSAITTLQSELLTIVVPIAVIVAFFSNVRDSCRPLPGVVVAGVAAVSAASVNVTGAATPMTNHAVAVVNFIDFSCIAPSDPRCYRGWGSVRRPLIEWHPFALARPAAPQCYARAKAAP